MLSVQHIQQPQGCTVYLGFLHLLVENLVGRKPLNLTNQIVEYTSYLLTSNCGPQNTTVGESLPKMAWSLGSQQIGSDNWLTPHLVDQDLPHKYTTLHWQGRIQPVWGMIQPVWASLVPLGNLSRCY